MAGQARQLVPTVRLAGHVNAVIMRITSSSGTTKTPAFPEAIFLMYLKWFRSEIVDNWRGPEQNLGGDRMP
jgi:hypothetical protein